MKAVRTRHLGAAVRRVAFAALALGLSLAGSGTGAVFAAGDGDLPGTGAGVVAEPSEVSRPASEPATDPGAEPAPPGAGDPVAPGAAPADELAPAEPVPGGPVPGELLAADGAPAADVSDLELSGEAWVVGQDLEVPAPAHLGRYPRATTEVAGDRTTAFGAFADPGAPGRGIAEAADPVDSPSWAECAYPESPETPAEDVRSPGQGATLTAVARCYLGAAQGAGYYARDPGPKATGGVELLRLAGAAATVDSTSNAAGATLTSSFSTLDQVQVAEVVKIDALTNGVTVRTDGRPGGAAVETTAIIGEMTIAGVPVGLPSDSLESVGPTLAGLPPVLTPLGVVTFDVVPEQKDAAADGTSAAGRAAQLLVTVENGQSTVRFALGFASAQGRTVLTSLAPPAAGSGPGVRRPVQSPFGTTTGQPYLRPAAGRGIPGSVGSVPRFGGSRAPRASVPAFRPGAATPPRPGAGAFPGGLPTAGLNVLPPAPPPQSAGGAAAYGGSGPWIALIGGSVIALALARYLAYSTALRPTAA